MGFLPAVFAFFLLFTPFTEEIGLNLTSVNRLVEYEYVLGTNELIPEARYRGHIKARWAVPDSALRNIDAEMAVVEITAFAKNSSQIVFISEGKESGQAKASLTCIIRNMTCAPESTLNTTIPFEVFTLPNQQLEASIMLKSEIKSAPAKKEDVLDRIKNAFSKPWQSEENEGRHGAKNGSEERRMESHSNSIIDGLQPKNAPMEPLEFIYENRLVSLLAIAIVAAVTGAYLLKSKE